MRRLRDELRDGYGYGNGYGYGYGYGVEVPPGLYQDEECDLHHDQV